MKEDTKIIIPAAGFGTRVGNPESKELFPHNGEPLIFRAINIAKNLNVRCHVITRVEKKSLIEYLKQFDHVDLQIITPSKEWPDSILQSEPYWAQKNLLILPDTTWSPLNIEKNLLEALDDFEIAVGSFRPKSLKTWGAFDSQLSTYQLVEKPSFESESLKAWGLIGFQKNIGKDLFNKILESTFDHQLKSTSYTFKEFNLENFTDLTR